MNFPDSGATDQWSKLRAAAEILEKQFEGFGDLYHGCLARSENLKTPLGLREKYKSASEELQRASNTALALGTALEGYLDISRDAGRLLMLATKDDPEQEGGK